MLDFTSALYLGLQHSSRSLRPWKQLSLGAPAALAPVPGAASVARKLAALQGCERAVLAPSTLHLFWDLLGIWAARGITVYLDDGAYPIARWGVDRARSLGARVRRVRHYDPGDLARQLARDQNRNRRPLLVVDGFCPDTGRPAPLPDYLSIVRAWNGILIVDDTQSLGLLGHNPGPGAPFGRGGGGLMSWHNLQADDVILVASLAKGFGVPLAALSGSAPWIRDFADHSQTLMYCSPPAVALVQAADHALELNHREGDAIRLRLARLVQHFRRLLAGFDLCTAGGPFPVQTLLPPPGLNLPEVYARLLGLGIKTVLSKGLENPQPRLTFIVTARHRFHDLGQAAQALAEACAANQRPGHHPHVVLSLSPGPDLTVAPP